MNQAAGVISSSPKIAKAMFLLAHFWRGVLTVAMQPLRLLCSPWAWSAHLWHGVLEVAMQALLLLCRQLCTCHHACQCMQCLHEVHAQSHVPVSRKCIIVASIELSIRQSAYEVGGGALPATMLALSTEVHAQTRMLVLICAMFALELQALPLLLFYALCQKGTPWHPIDTPLGGPLSFPIINCTRWFKGKRWKGGLGPRERGSKGGWALRERGGRAGWVPDNTPFLTLLTGTRSFEQLAEL
eukprot:1147808-Pelagomonas_calceolata.AAC.3